MNYSESDIMRAFDIYTTLARDGVADKDAMKEYTTEADVGSLLEAFAHKVDCVIIHTTDELYMIPKAQHSPFHVSNEWIKRNYLGSNAVNADIYLLYFVTLVLFGSFFDRYNSQEPTLDFLPLVDWLTEVNERITYLQSHDEEELIEKEEEFTYNWRAIIDKWEDMDDIKESAKRQRGRTISRLSFIHTVKNFLIKEGLLTDIGNNEVNITEKANVIIQRYFMDVTHNNNIFEFIYADEEETNDGNDT
ncbi:MAG TPA: DUF6063 family protein [Pseudogracilibacillus sp.]|nr:DUF6063 family protein [Pseudogracilibacillus sp.]